MRRASRCCGWIGLLLACAPWSAQARNLVIFVADGLRPGSVTLVDAPTLAALRDQGVSFSNSHSLFPTFTTPNAAAIATGHYLGDTGDYSNSLYTGYRLFNAGNFGRLPASSTPFIESDSVLADMDDHFEGNVFGEESLLAIARSHGYGTAAVGKLGPVAIQDVSQLAPRDGKLSVPQTILIDDATGADAPPLDPEVNASLRAAGLPTATPARVQPTGDSQHAGARNTNSSQQAYFIEATTRVVLPLLKKRARPFVLVYWSRDPDGTQHNQGDSLNRLSPGINGRTSRAAVTNADDNLRQLLDAIHADAELANDTDVFVTSDHGFATISKQALDAAHHVTGSYSASVHYDDVPAGFLPPGFLAIDLAQALNLPLFDPESPAKDSHGNPVYQRVLAGAARFSAQERAHPLLGHGWIGGSGRPADASDAQVVVAANGGSDLIYLPHGDAAQAQQLAAILARLDYVDALFVADRFGAIAGALPLSSIALDGSAELPQPAMVVSFKTFALDPSEAISTDPLQNAVQIADTTLQQGQGMHGSFGRDNTFNFMAASGPDFKQRFRDLLPASNADIAPTLLHILGLGATARGALSGRVLTEALRDSPVPSSVVAQQCLAQSQPLADGRRTLLRYQRLEGRLYFDEARLAVPNSQQRGGCRAR